MDPLKMLRERYALRDSYRRVFDGPDGERVLRHIMRQGFVTKSTFVANDPEQTALNEGSRRLALSIVKFVRKTDDEITKQIERSIEDENAQ